MKFTRKLCLLFLIGAIGYGIIEVIWRGYTHWSMLIAGGLCFILFSAVSRLLTGGGLIIKATVCAVGVTLVELIFGIVFNVILKMNVWDYSHLPLNLLGQICPFFSLMWMIVAIIFLPLADLINRKYA